MTDIEPFDEIAAELHAPARRTHPMVEQSFLGQLEKFPEPHGGSGPPPGSVAAQAVEYGKAREQLDAITDEGKDVAEELRRTIALADELAVRVMRNPTSRIRPAYDRRGMAGTAAASVPGNTRKIKIGESRWAASVPYVDATEGADKTGELWALQQRLFNAKMDFLSYRVGKGLIAVGETEVDIELRLRARTAPDVLNTNGQDVDLPLDVEYVHYYETSGSGGFGYEERD